MDRYRVFLSSPTDVQPERDRAELVINRLNAERVDHTLFELVRWEQEYYSATSDFQTQIPKPADCHLVVCIFWKRLGTQLPQAYARPDGTIPTGSEYEFEMALEAAGSRPEKLPDVLVYHKTAEILFSQATLEYERAQYDRFMAFWQRWFYSEKGHFLAGFQSFADPDEFETVFERNLRSWLRDREVELTWTKGSPFRGLEPFDVEHAPIFFGRRREVERARARLLACVTAGKPFLLIIGASGSGKSSLARAGLIPRLGQVGGLSTLGAAMRWVIVTPGQIAADWAAGLAQALFEKTAIGDELSQGDFQSADELKGQFARVDYAAVLPLLKALRRAGEAIAARENRAQPLPVMLLVLIDQFEELFAWPKAAAEAFLQLLKSISETAGSPVWLIATMRSDFQHRLGEYAPLEALAGRTEVKGPGEVERILELALPAPGDLRDMIVQPARAAGLLFEVSADGSRDLAQLIDREAQPEAMPAVQFLLSELYRRRHDSVLTLEAFDALGGVVGVMANRGEEIYLSVSDAARQAFPRIVRALVTQVGGDAPPSARRIPQQVFAADPAAVQMIEALQNARLILSDRGELRFTHETILNSWKRLRDQIDEEQRLFETRERLEQLCRRWAQVGKSGSRPTGLLLQGFQLAEGRELLAKWDAASLADREPELPDYISASDAREKRVRRGIQAIGWVVAVVFALLSWSLYQFWLSAEAARKEAQASLWVTSSGAALKDGRISAAINYAAQAFELRPNETSRSALATALFELSPNLRSTFVTGGVDEALAWMRPGTVVVASANEGGQLRAFLPEKPQSGVAATDFPMPRVTRVQDGNRAVIRVMCSVNCAVGPDRLLAVLDNGAVALMERSAIAASVRAPSQGVTLAGGAHAAAIGRSGRFIVMANVDADVLLLDCTLPSGTAPECKEGRLAGVRGRAVAISPDETRVAIGDETGAVSVYDRSGQRIGGPIAGGGSLLALDWANGRDWLAVGAVDGSILVIDLGAPGQPRLATASLGRGPITTVAWSSNGSDLVFACEGRNVCLWPISAGADSAASFGPIRRFQGHQNSVTRLAWSPGGEQFASSAADGTLRIWTPAQNTDGAMSLYAEAETRLSRVAISPDGRRLAAGAKDGAIRVWDAQSRALLQTIRPSYGTEVAALAWSRGGLLAGAHDSRGVTLIPMDAGRPATEIAVDTAPFGARITFVENDKMLAMTRAESAIALIDASGSGAPLRHLAPIGPDQTAFGLAADSAGKTLFVSYTDDDGKIRIWDVAAQKPAGEMAYALAQKRDPTAAGSLSISGDGRWLATSGGDNYVRIYDIPNRTAWQALGMESNEPQCVAFSPDGRKLAALAADSRVYIWELSEKGAALYLTFKAVSPQSSVVDAAGVEQVATWLTWLTNDSIAFAAGTSSISVMGLDPAKWKRRVAPAAGARIP